MSAGGFIFKSGTTFALTADFADQLGSAVDLAGAAFRSELRDSLGDLVAELTVAADPTTMGRAVITYPGSTAAWPVGQLRCDVLVTWATASVQQTETFVVQVIRGVTAVAS